jgi:hypothetical protein
LATTWGMPVGMMKQLGARNQEFNAGTHHRSNNASRDSSLCLERPLKARAQALHIGLKVRSAPIQGSEHQ